MLYLFAQATRAAGEAVDTTAAKAVEAVTKAGEVAGQAADGATPAAIAGAASQAADGVVEAGSWLPAWVSDMLTSGAMGYMIEGGLFMWPILILGVIAFGVIIERWRSLKMLQTNVDDLRQRVLGILQDDRIEEALTLCESQQGPVPAILSAGLRKLLLLRRLNYDTAKVEEQVVKAMDDYGIHMVAALERHLPILATVSSVAPMIGFLGTVQGMVVSFKDIVASIGSKNIVEAAADGIQVALLTTVLGLIVGIPAFIAFNYFTSVINRFVLDLEESSTELIETVTLQIALQEQEVADRQLAKSAG